MSNIAGRYFTRFLVPDSEYEFTDDVNARNANFAPSTNDKLIVTPHAANSVGLNAPILLPIQNDFLIVRARLVSTGADELRPGNAFPFVAGLLRIGAAVEDPDNPGHALPLDSICITLTAWNEWQDINKKIRPYVNVSGVNIDSYISAHMYVDCNDVNFYCDDYNIQGAYKSQKTKPILEMDVKTAGLYDTVNKVLF